MSRVLVHIAVVATILTACGKPPTDESEVMWGVHTMARSANLLNLKPRESVEVCADSKDRLDAAHEAIRQWATALGRWGHFKINPCNSNSNVKINMLRGNETGLNYFTANPGRIYIQSSASGKFMSAIVLHEFGHSFGMCDQYASGGGCSSHSTPRKENSEVMGSTSADKQKLTPGDIEGVRKAASVIRTDAAIAWEQFLATNPQGTEPNTGGNVVTAGDVFVAVTSNESETLSLVISVPAGASAVALCQGSGASCKTGDAGSLSLRSIGSRNGRDLYEAQSLANVQQATVDFVSSYTQQSAVKSKRFRAKKV